MESEPRWIVEGAGGMLVPVNDSRDDGRPDGALWIFPCARGARRRWAPSTTRVLTIEGLRRRIAARRGRGDGRRCRTTRTGCAIEQLRRGAGGWPDAVLRSADAWRARAVGGVGLRPQRRAVRVPPMMPASPKPRTGGVATLTARDRAHVWHPYTQMQTAPPPLPIVSGEGVYLYTEDGRRLLDGISSWWVNIHGHSHPVLNEALARRRTARARDVCGLHASAGGRSRGAAGGGAPAGPDARVLFGQRIDGRRSRGEAGHAVLDQQGRAAAPDVRHASPRVSRRHRRRDVGERGLALHARVRAAAVRGHARACAVLLPVPAGARARVLRDRCLGRPRAGAGIAGRRRGRRDRRADAAGRRRDDRLAGGIPGRCAPPVRSLRRRCSSPTKCSPDSAARGGCLRASTPTSRPTSSACRKR